MTSVQNLLECLKSKRQEDRAAAAKELGFMKAEAVTALAAIVQALCDSEPYVRLEAATALGRIGEPTPEVIGALVDALGDRYAKVRKRAFASLVQMGPVILPDIIAATEKDNPLIREGAINIIGRLGVINTLVVNTLVELDESSGSGKGDNSSAHLGFLHETTIWVRQALANLGPRAARLLVDMYLNPHDAEKMVWALNTLAAVAKGLSDDAVSVSWIIQRVLPQLASDSSTVRSAAYGVLCGYANMANESAPSVAEATVSALVGSLSAPSPDVRIAVACCLGKLVNLPLEAVPALIEGLRAPSETLRFDAAATLGKAGRNAAVASNALEATLTDPCPSVAFQAAVSLTRIAPERANAAVAILLRALATEPLREEAAFALIRMGREYELAIAALVGPYRDGRWNYPDIVHETVLGLREIDPLQVPIKFWIEALHIQYENWYPAAEIIEQLGPGAIPELEQALEYVEVSRRGIIQELLERCRRSA